MNDKTNEDETFFDGCLCEYIREDYRARLERAVAAGGGGEPGTIISFANVILQVNQAIENYLVALESQDGRQQLARKPKKAPKTKRRVRVGLPGTRGRSGVSIREA